MLRAFQTLRDIRRRLQTDSGATAIEFAMIGPIFFTLLFSTLELSWLAIKMVVLDNAVEIATKQIYTGNVPDRASFEQLICDNASLFQNCTSLINVEAVTISSHADVPSTDAECRDSSDSSFSPSTTYTTGTSSAVMFLRVCVTAPLITPGLGLGASLPKQPDGSFAMISTAVFMNEPF